MITTAVVCPHPPALLRELGGLVDPVADLRDACGEALRSALAGEPDTVVVVGGAPATGRWQPSVPIGVRRFGTTTARDARYLPQSLGVARRLLEEAGWDGPLRLQAVAWDAGAEEVAGVAAEVVAAPGRTVLLVMADGSARRGEKAPGHLDDRAFGYDDEIGRALQRGDAAALAGLDAPLAADLLVQGRAALAVLGTAALATWESVATEGTAAERVTTEVLATEGTAAEGYAPKGAAAEGYAPKGAAAEGDAAEADAAEGAAAEADAAEGAAAEGEAAGVDLGGVPNARLFYRDDPYGVMYTVATWSFTP